MVISPRISEKSYGLSRQNIYVFDVPMSANKAEVAREIAREYPDIEVADIRLMITKGKVKSVNRGKRARPGLTKRSDTKSGGQFGCIRNGKQYTDWVVYFFGCSGQ